MFDQKTLDMIDEQDNWGTTINWLEDQKLNVPACLAFLFVRHTKKYSSWSVDKLINMSKIYLPKYAIYADDVQKYLMLV